MSESFRLPFVSSGAFKTKSVQQIVTWALDGMIDRVELGSGTNWVPNVLQPVRETSGRPIHYLVHNYFPPHEQSFVLNLAASDPESLDRSLAHCRSAIDLSVELGAPFFSVHAGFAFKAKPEHLGGEVTKAPRVTLEEAHKSFVRSLQHLCAYADGKGIKLAVENNVIASFNLVDGKNLVGLCATAEDILQTYRDVGSSSLGFLVDVGHLKVSAMSLGFDMQAFLDHVAPHVVAFHLSDNDGMTDQNRPFDEKAWFVPRLAEFPNATMVLEAYNLDVATIRENRRVIIEAQSRIPTT
jgi:sugar phosphate isomerase/epimerase